MRWLQALIIILLFSTIAQADPSPLFKTQDTLDEAYGLTIYFARCSGFYRFLSERFEDLDDSGVADYLHDASEKYKSYALMLALYAEVQPREVFVNHYRDGMQAELPQPVDALRMLFAHCTAPANIQQQIFDALREKRQATAGATKSRTFPRP